MHRQMLTLLLLLGGTLSAGATEPLPPGEMTLKEGAARTGSLLRRDVAWSTKIPLNRTYAELSPEEKATLHAYYEFIGPNDEPPFPLEGLGPIIKAIQQGQEKRLARGEVKLLVTVGADGKAIKVAAQGKTDDVTMVRFVGTVLKLTPYKPAICDGKPCTMQYPFFLKLKVEKSVLENGLAAREVWRAGS